ncbi:MAG: alpha/beta hydrolase [Gammaproteobacteria bacterium]|nr:alpha/beta hydrolase [Gammaproteobacteria bacterium]
MERRLADNEMVQREPRRLRRVDLECRYDRRSQVPDLSPWLTAWREGTRNARERTRELRLDIGYGRGEVERIDLYPPHALGRKLPFVAFVPSGLSTDRPRADAGFPAKAVHSQGAAFAVIGIDSAPETDFAHVVDQVRRAWLFLVRNAQRLGLDPTRGHLLGHSFGALAAALVAFQPDLEVRPRSALLVSGVYDLNDADSQPAPDSSDFSADLAGALSPVRLLRRDGPATVVAWGSEEPEAFRRQGLQFVGNCREHGLAVSALELPGRNHLDTSLDLSRRDSHVLSNLRRRDIAA